MVPPVKIKKAPEKKNRGEGEWNSTRTYAQFEKIAGTCL
jgi:hypothetical protein